MADKSVFKADIDLSFNNGSTIRQILRDNIIYVFIEYLYDNNVASMPMIYLSLACDDNLYADILNHQSTGRFRLTINLKPAFEESTVMRKTMLDQEFTYISSSTNPNFTQDLSPEDTLDTNYRKLILALASVEMNNNMRMTFNSIYRDIDCNTLFGIATDGLNCIVEPPKYNDWYDSIIVPPVTTRLQFLQHIYSLNQFYDTNFTMFMDFDKTYLLSKAGTPIPSTDPINVIMLDVRKLSEGDAYVDGYTIENGCYYVNINPANSNVEISQGQEKVANQIISVSDDGAMFVSDLNVNNVDGSTAKPIFIRTSNGDAAMLKNETEMDTITISALKNNIDPDIFTPNKLIYVNNYEEYSQYNGNYILAAKRAFFKGAAGEFFVSCYLNLKKATNIAPSNRVITTRPEDAYAAPSASVPSDNGGGGGGSKSKYASSYAEEKANQYTNPVYTSKFNSAKYKSTAYQRWATTTVGTPTRVNGTRKSSSGDVLRALAGL